MPNVEVAPAAAHEEPVLDNLLQLYAYDFSEIHQIDLSPTGRFEYKELPLYWQDPQRHPFLVRIDGKLAGFALVKQASEISADPSIWDVAEFFVLRGYRRRGIGIEIAHQLWRRFPGTWEVRVMESNIAALPFWQRAVAEFIGTPASAARVEKGGKRWQVFSFVSE